MLIFVVVVAVEGVSTIDEIDDDDEGNGGVGGGESIGGGAMATTDRSFSVRSSIKSPYSLENKTGEGGIAGGE